MELQSRKMRILFRGDQWQTEVDVYDTHGRHACRSVNHPPADARFSSDSRFGYRCFGELQDQVEDQKIQAAQTRCARRNVAYGTRRHRSRSGVSKMYRMLSLPGCV